LNDTERARVAISFALLVRVCVVLFLPTRKCTE
jgi:hypothetical protein